MPKTPNGPPVDRTLETFLREVTATAAEVGDDTIRQRALKSKQALEAGNRNEATRLLSAVIRQSSRSQHPYLVCHFVDANNEYEAVVLYDAMKAEAARGVIDSDLSAAYATPWRHIHFRLIQPNAAVDANDDLSNSDIHLSVDTSRLAYAAMLRGDHVATELIPINDANSQVHTE